MSTVKQIEQALKDSLSLKMVAEAYTEIGVLKLKKIRAGIERNRSFFQGISEVFHIINVEATKRHIRFKPKLGTVSILITSNFHFYGGLESDLVKLFLVNTTKFQTDRIAIGVTAQEFLKAAHYPHPYRHFVFKKDLPSAEEIRLLVSEINQYEQIMIYYSRMHTVLTQEPHVVNILQKLPEYYMKTQAVKINYIFEPELEMIVNFFENQITLLLIEQIFLESELARTAARLTAMDQSQLAANEIIQKQKRELAMAKRSLNNIHLLESIATIKAYRDEQ